jgi:hypothetical protein
LKLICSSVPSQLTPRLAENHVSQATRQSVRSKLERAGEKLAFAPPTLDSRTLSSMGKFGKAFKATFGPNTTSSDSHREQRHAHTASSTPPTSFSAPSSPASAQTYSVSPKPFLKLLPSSGDGWLNFSCRTDDRFDRPSFESTRRRSQASRVPPLVLQQAARFCSVGALRGT